MMNKRDEKVGEFSMKKVYVSYLGTFELIFQNFLKFQNSARSVSFLKNISYPKVG